MLAMLTLPQPIYGQFQQNRPLRAVGSASDPHGPSNGMVGDDRSHIVVNEAHAREVFNMFDLDGNGFLTYNEFVAAAKRFDSSVNPRLLMAETDANGDHMVSFEEFMDALANAEQRRRNGGITSALGRLVKAVHVPASRQNEKDLDYLDEYRCWPPPVLLVMFSLAQLIVFLVYNQRDCSSNPTIECPYSWSSPLAFRPGCREEVWRFLSYIFVHSGVQHIVFNLIIQFLIGLPIEMVEGPFRTIAVYLMGGLAGSLASSVADPNTNVVGASACVYALIGAHIAELVLNWSEMPFRYIRAAVLFVVVGVDTGFSIYQRYFVSGPQKVSYVGHFAGFIMGCTLGIAILKNIRRTRAETILGIIGVVIASVFIIFAIFWNIFYHYNSESC